MTPAEREAAKDYLRQAAPRIRALALEVGSMHNGWHVLKSIDHFLIGTPSYGYNGDDGLRELVSRVRRDYPTPEEPT